MAKTAEAAAVEAATTAVEGSVRAVAVVTECQCWLLLAFLGNFVPIVNC